MNSIIRKIKKGNQQALDAFIREMYPSVYAFAYRKMQGNDACKDVTQEVFLRFIKHIAMYHEEGKSLHYLYRITSNVCNDYYRKRARHNEDIDDIAYAISTHEDVHEIILTQMRDEELLLYVQALTPLQQDVILLKYYHQMTFKEIAEVFDIPISTVKSRHSAALSVLRKQWKESDTCEA